MVRVVAKQPAECSEALIEDFQAFVRAGGEVGGSALRRRIRDGKVLVFLYDNGCLSGIAALKRPTMSYRQKLVTKSGVSLDEAAYPYELGYIFVLPSSRGKHYSHRLTEVAMRAAESNGVFATSRTDNKAMHATLKRYSFVTAGRQYSSSRGQHELQLFIRFPTSNTAVE
jgi:hypothetical protein